MTLLCACGRKFKPSVKDGIQILCGVCIDFHQEGDAHNAPSWKGSGSKGRAVLRPVGVASGVVGGEVGGVTPISKRRARG